MKKQVALIFGASGGIGLSTRKIFLDNGFRIIPVNSNILDFDSENSDQEIQSLLTNANADVVINCAGVFENNWQQDHKKTMNINFGSNWSIVRHYMNPDNQAYTTRVIMIGSSNHSGGRKLYPLYAASKAAVYNLWQSANQVLADTNITIDLVNPVRTLPSTSSKGKDINSELDYSTPEQVAEQIYKLVKEDQPSRCIDMTFEDAK